jgi:hypothetical protein
MPLLWVKNILAVINGGMLVFMIGTVVGHIMSRNKLRSWASAFNSLCILWLCMRQVFWTYAIYSTGYWSAVRFYILYWLPHPIQFAMYLIIPIFYVQILSKTGRHRFGMSASLWQKRRKCIRNTYIAVVAAMLVFLVGFVLAAAVLEKKEYRCVSRHWHRGRSGRDHRSGGSSGESSDSCYRDMSAKPVRFLSASCFLFLSVVIAVYGAQVG